MIVPARRRGLIGLSLFTLAIVGLLIGLGVWQLQRRTAKHALLAALSERLTATPGALPAAATWKSLTPATDEFRRVTFTAVLKPLPDAMVYGSGSAVRPDAVGPVSWAFLPAQLPTGETVVIDAGFVQNTMQDRAQQDRAVQRLITGAPVAMTGYLRFPEAAGSLTATADAGKRLWFTRDIGAMAEKLGWGAVAPFYVDLESPVPPSGVPRPGPLEVRLKDDHLQYAITWFGLAAAVLGAFGVWVRQRSSP